MTEAENHQPELERQELIDELADEANFHLLMANTLGITSVTPVLNGAFIVSAHGRTFKFSVEEV